MTRLTNWFTSALAGALACCALAGTLHGQTVNITTIADTNNLSPDYGFNFTGFTQSPVLNGGTLAFVAPDGFGDGIFSTSLAAPHTLTTIADDNTLYQGSPVNPTSANVGLSNGQYVFVGGYGNSDLASVFSTTGGTPSLIAQQNQTSPDGSGQYLFVFGSARASTRPAMWPSKQPRATTSVR